MKKWLVSLCVFVLLSSSATVFAGFLENLGFKGPVKEIIGTETRGYPDWQTQIITKVYTFDENGKMTSRIQRINGKPQQFEKFDSKERLVKQEAGGNLLLIEYDDTKKSFRVGQRDKDLKEIGTLDETGNIMEMNWEHQGQSYKTMFVYTLAGVVQEEKVYATNEGVYEKNLVTHRKYNSIGQEISFLVQSKVTNEVNQELHLREYDREYNLIRITRKGLLADGTIAFQTIQENKYIESSKDKYGNYIEYEITIMINDEKLRKSKVERKIVYYIE